jgi:DNA-directed RNA polymerase beta subunit
MGAAAAAASALGELTPTKVYPPIASVENGELRPRDMLSFISAAVLQEGLVSHHIQGYNDLITSGLSQIMTQMFNVERMISNERTQTEADRKRKSFQYSFQFHDVKVGRPTCTTYLTGQFTDLYPSRARLTGQPYSGPVTVGATVTLRAFYEDGRVEEKSAEIPAFQIGGFPTMVGGINCHTTNCPRDALKEMGEDPADPGGNFITGRNEVVVDLLENIRYNSPHIHTRMMANEHVRLEFLSQPGGAFENSSQVRIRYRTNGQITAEINSTKFEKVQLPFFVLFRLFGMTDDRTVVETIVFDASDRSPLTGHMLDILERAFHLADAAFTPLISELNRERLVQMTAERIAKYLTNPTAYLSNESAIQFLNEDLLGSPSKPGGLDRVLLPHMGQTAESRIRKLRFLGLLIRKVLLVHLGVLDPTDRDSYRNKRAHGAGVSLAKAFKTQVNNSLIIPIGRALKRELKNNPWESITAATIADVFKSGVGMADLNRAMEQAITAGNKTIVVRRKAAVNRVSSQVLERKNCLNTFSALRTVITQNAGNASKATERADMMRRVHPTYSGFICVAQSADTGENVGMRKQLAITTGSCTAGEALPLKLRLLADRAVTPLDLVASPDLARRNLAAVFVNGEWIGVCDDAQDLVRRCRAMRREGRGVDPFTTIYWDPKTDDVEFWLDVGRLRRPLLIVDNNLDEYDAALRARHAGVDTARVEFVQNIRFTPAHAREIVAGRLSLADLVREGIAEYITPEEQENCLVAGSVAALHLVRNDVTTRFTHCDIEQAIFGLAAHVSPFGNHTQPARVTYQTNQGRQTGGWYALNFPFRTDKNRFFQFYNEIPLVRTITHKFVPANGTNVIIAYASYGGDNQEDSAIVCRASADRGLFAGAFFRFELAELEKGEAFCRPDPLTTKNLKPGACYEKLVDGFIRVGSVVRFGDVLVGRVAKLGRGRGAGAGAGAAEQYQFTDRSVVYRLHEPAVVEGVLRPRGANDELFGLVKLRYERPLRVGDKISSRSGNKCLAGEHLVLARARGGAGAPPKWRPIADVVRAKDAVELSTPDGWAVPTAVHAYNDCPLFEISVGTVFGFVVVVCRATPAHRMRVVDADGAASFRLVSDLRVGVDRIALWPTGVTLPVINVAAAPSGPAYCFSVPGEVFATTLPGGLAHWTGNSIVASMLQQSDMPFTESGLTPDMVINTHCIAAETPITTYYGTSRRIDALPEAGGAVLWGWDDDKYGFVESHQIARMARGDSEVVRVTLGDGRTLRCTPNHRIMTLDEYDVCVGVEAGLLTPDHRVVMGPEAPLDEPGADEAGWSFTAADVTFTMADETDRERAMAFARLLGLLCSDGTVAEYAPGIIAQVYLGHPLDVDAALRDIRVLTGKTPAATRSDGVWIIRLPVELGRRTAVPGMTRGKKTCSEPDWPHVILDPACPTALVREFIGGLFGGDGHAPCLVSHKAENRKAKSGVVRYGLLGVCLDLSIIEDHSAAMRRKMEQLCGLLARVGVPDTAVSGPVRRESSAHALDGRVRVQYGVRIPPSTAFATKVGFRYCVQKAARLTAATAYWRYTENVRRQHELVFQRVGVHYAGGGTSIAGALDRARRDLLDAEPALNEYYSLLTMNIVNNRRRSAGRKTTLERFDYTHIEDAAAFFERAGCLEWFLKVGGDGTRIATDYITVLAESALASFTLNVVDVRPDGRALTYDLSVPISTTFVAGGLTVGNSFPSRMTIGQLIETSLGKVCARKGVIADGTAFLPVDHLEIAREMKELGFRFNGRERMYNGMTGEYFDAAIFIGPTAEQRLQKFVLDDEQSVAGSGPTDATTGQPLGGKHVQGGLRLGEMENWCLASHGSMMNLFEKTSTDSDGRKMYVCRGCGSLAAFNEFHNVYQCRSCGELADIAAVDGSKSAILLHEELAAANVHVRLGLRPREFEAAARRDTAGVDDTAGADDAAATDDAAGADDAPATGDAAA